MSTRLEGPYDHLDSMDKHRVQCVIPSEVYEKWFGRSGAFPLRGAQDKILARLFHLLDLFMTEHDLFDEANPHNEDLLNDVMSEISIDYKP